MRHTALEPAPGRPLASAPLTDRARLSIVLQAGALLAHLRLAGWRMDGDWQAGSIDRHGLLRSLRARPGRPRRWSQEALLELVALLFGGRPGEVPGRGEARRAVRELVERWRQKLVPLAPDEAVGQVLDAADFLSEPAFARPRHALAAEHRRGGRRWLWVAGPGPLREPLLRGVSSRAELLERLASFAVAPRRRSERAESGLERSRRLAAEGRFAEADELAEELAGASAKVLRISCRVRLGRLEAARRALKRLDSAGLQEEELLELAEAAVRLFGSLGDLEASAAWAGRALDAASGENRTRAHLLAACAAWDRHDRPAAERALEQARPALADPDLAWRWHHVAALVALGRGDAPLAAGEQRRALGGYRRRMTGFEAATLWNDLGVARAELGDLAGAERALLHTVRLHAGAEGPRRTTLALCNLAEIRLRRGVPKGVRGALERSVEANRQSRNWRALAYDHELWSRYELVRGRPEAALSRAEEALDDLRRRGLEWRRSALRAVAARALGWLGREGLAAEALSHIEEGEPLPFESEELPALWALAGDRERALTEVREGPGRRLWKGVLGGHDLMPDDWRELDALEPFRAARLVVDLEMVLPGSVPRERLRQALAALSEVDAPWLRERLQEALEGAWNALEGYLAGAAGGARELAALFRRSGHRRAWLVWRRGGREHEIVAGEGGPAVHQAPLAGGTLVLESERIDGVARALFELASRDWRPPEEEAATPPGIVGESPALLAALERSRRLARREVPVLITGETGTGKELVARYVHRHSRRRGGPLVPLNSAALSETLVLSDLFGHARGAFTGADRDRAGIFETARGGTVFLDEIGDLPTNAQALLLRVLQEGEVRRLGESRTRRVDVRVVAATHRRLERLVERGRFRADLFYRLAVGVVELPPLRERGADLDLLVEHFLSRGGGPPRRLSPAAAARLQAHSWPGNVRELGNCLAVAAALAEGGVVRRRHLGLPAARASERGGYHQRVLEFRRRLVKEALDAAGGNRAAAARRLGVSRQALTYLVRSLGLG